MPLEIPSTGDRLAFEQLVFSGGGTRCFWHGGFLEVVAPAIHLHPDRVIGVSGGALSAAAMIAERAGLLKRVMIERFEAVDSNIDLQAVPAGDSITPHQRIYGDIVAEVLDDDTARARIADGPDFHVQLGHPPSRLAPRASTIPLFSLYEAEKRIRGTPHLRWAQAAGLRARLVDARAAARDGRLVELICAAAVIPPVFKIAMWEGEQVIDSGMANKAPMPPNDQGRTLVLLTDDFPNTPDHPDRSYVSPSRETPADKIDFTDPGKLRRTWELGRHDGAAFLERHGKKAEKIH
jgi:predicted acylesterase/phospholipase RssA